MSSRGAGEADAGSTGCQRCLGAVVPVNFNVAVHLIVCKPVAIKNIKTILCTKVYETILVLIDHFYGTFSKSILHRYIFEREISLTKNKIRKQEKK